MRLDLNEEKKEFFMKTFVWNSLVEFFKEKKDLDISEFLVSVKIFWKNITVKTNKPILNSEILLYKDEISLKIEKKFKNIWVDFWKFILKII